MHGENAKLFHTALSSFNNAYSQQVKIKIEFCIILIFKRDQNIESGHDLETKLAKYLLMIVLVSAILRN